MTTGFSCDTGFSALNSNWGKRTWKRPNWLDNCTWLGISSERLACCEKGTCHGLQSTVGSATTEIRTLIELGLHTFILRTSVYLLAVQLLMLTHQTPWCKSQSDECKIAGRREVNRSPARCKCAIPREVNRVTMNSVLYFLYTSPMVSGITKRRCLRLPGGTTHWWPRAIFPPTTVTPIYTLSLLKKNH